MSNGHTPGPWEVYGTKFSNSMGVRAVGGRKICAPSANNNDLSNARLIAAAPDLLAALEAATQWLHDNCADDEPLRQCRAAIAKTKV